MLTNKKLMKVIKFVVVTVSKEMAGEKCNKGVVKSLHTYPY